MKNEIGVIFLVTSVFTSFLLGYSLPPLLETGMIGGRGQVTPAVVEPQVDKQLEEYYRKLLEQN